MPLHPQVRAFLGAIEAQPAIDFTTITAAEFRSIMAPPPAFISAGIAVRVEERQISGPGGALSLRLYMPSGTTQLPITLYFLGGGFTIGRPEQWDHICSALAKRANTIVVSVGYRLAPENPFPAAVEDAFAALRWTIEHGSEFDGDTSRIAVAGDSSGGNLAAVLAQVASAKGIRLRHQLLFYPALDARGDTISYRQFATGYWFTAAWMDWYWRQYLPDRSMAADARVSPLRFVDLRKLPSATVFTAEYDILRDEAEAYATALVQAGVPVQSKRWLGQIHGFLYMIEQFDDAKSALDEAAATLRSAFA